MTAFWSWTARGVALICLLGSLGADWLAPAPFDYQDRESAMEAPSARFPLGTDELGRDRLSRLLHGSRVSFGLALGAAFASTLLAAALGAAERVFVVLAELIVAIPSLF